MHRISLLEAILHWCGVAIEGAGVAVIMAGGLIATTKFLGGLMRRQEFSLVYRSYRANLGRAILIGLEFLVAADIIGTVAMEPTFEKLGVLAVIIVIRTFLSFSLEVEIDGHWPWEKTKYRGLQQRDKM